MPVTYAILTHTGLVRRTNEDSYFARTPVFVVADGMGGAQAGEIASAMAAQAFEYFLPQSSRPGEELAELIARVNQSIYEFAMSDSGRTGMGTTLTAAVISSGTIDIAHVGDSRAWLLRDGELSRLTEDHSLVAEMIREGQITETEAADHPQRSIITRALGVEPSVEVDISSVEWRPGDVFLLASDGLYGMVSEEEVAAILSGHRNLQEAAGALVEAANARGGTDNITVVLFCPDGSVPGISVTGNAEEATGVFPATGDRPGGDPPAAGAVYRSRGERVRAWFSTLPGLVVIGLVLAAIVLGGAWFATRFAYYLGVEESKVSIFRGVPYDLGPLSLSSVYRSSSIKFDDLDPFEQERVAKQEIQTRGGAETMLDNLMIQDRRRKEETERLANEEEERKKQKLKTFTVPPGGGP